MGVRGSHVRGYPSKNRDEEPCGRCGVTRTTNTGRGRPPKTVLCRDCFMGMTVKEREEWKRDG